MKTVSKILFLFFLSFTASQCGDSSQGNSAALTISGNIKGANSMQVFLDKVGLGPGATTTVLTKAEVGPNGDFTLKVPEKIQPGIYRLRFGLQRVTLILDGSEKDIKLTGDLARLNSYQYQVEGSPNSTDYQAMLQKLASRQATLDEVSQFIESTPNALAAALVATQSLGGNKQYMNIFNKAKERLEKQYPGSPYINEYSTYLTSIQKIKNPSRSFTKIPEAERQPAPDIKLPGPDGKVRALSDLKGKVVLLDFWASWCGPCRRENPNVVKIYNKYKDKGFTVFSVSLDGLDSRTAARYGGDQSKIQQAREQSKKRWIDAIKKDKLTWDYHVSDLKKWECEPAKAYGVTSIPRTFMIDREGRIAAMNLRGEQIEEMLRELL